MANTRYDQAFATFDVDKDGKITKSEFGAALKKLGREITDKDLTALMTAVDKDANGYIDKKEFYQMMETQKANEKKLLNETFKKFDRDGSGFISKSELKITMKELGVDLTDKEVEDTIKEVDLNQDGKISRDEFEKMMSRV